MSPIKRSNYSLLKVGIDTLPMGICFFDENGYLTLCNRRMKKLFFALCETDIQVQMDLDEALEHPQTGVIRSNNIYYLPDKTVWQFSKNFVKTRSGQTFLEVVAKNITVLQQELSRLRASNDELHKVLNSLQQLSKYIVALSREKEILKIKTQLHNDLGDNLHLIHYAMQEALSPEEEQLFWQKQQMLSENLLNRASADERVNPLEELLELCHSLGRELQIEGVFPENTETSGLLMDALRVSLNNMIRHTDGVLLSLTLQYADGRIIAAITNDGTPPTAPIVERGGLTNLRSKVEAAGGMMEITSMPRFVLRLSLVEQEVSI